MELVLAYLTYPKEAKGLDFKCTFETLEGLKSISRIFTRFD